MTQAAPGAFRTKLFDSLKRGDCRAEDLAVRQTVAQGLLQLVDLLSLAARGAIRRQEEEVEDDNPLLGLVPQQADKQVVLGLQRKGARLAFRDDEDELEYQGVGAEPFLQFPEDDKQKRQQEDPALVA